jgi:glycogen operon protein
MDAFRFDLAAVLARGFLDVDRLAVFFDLVHRDPIVSQGKLIAEPCDVGDSGYPVGGFPPLWTEWNGKYRDTMRDFWHGTPATMGEFATRFTGSSDLYENYGRRPVASINFVTAHDGFTLADLVPTTRNTARRTARTTGTVRATTGRGTVELKDRPTTWTPLSCVRERRKCSFLAILLLSQGVADDLTTTSWAAHVGCIGAEWAALRCRTVLWLPG